MVTYRVMTEEDVKKVAEIERRSFFVPWQEKDFTEQLKNPYTLYTVGLKDGEIICYGGMWCIYEDAHVTNIAVHPDLRGKGISHGLICFMLSAAKSMGCHHMTLEVRISNERAIHLYSRWGFQTIGIRKEYYTDNLEDAYIMQHSDVQQYELTAPKDKE